MLQDVRTVTCPHCKEQFTAFITEQSASATPSPVTCPHCGHTFTPSIATEVFSLLGSILKLFK